MELFEENDLYSNLLRQRRLNNLWDVNEAVHEVQIFKENNVLEKTFDDILNMSGIHCHICNLEVPKMYIKEHNQTTTHQNLLKVTDEALERTRKHITNIETSNTTIKVENTYFCDICSRIVQNSEKEIHERSNFHKKRETFNNLLSCFVDSYLNINDLNYNVDNENCDIKKEMAKYGILLSDIEKEELQKTLFETLEPTHIQELLKIQNKENTDLKPELTKKQAQELNQNQNSTQELFKNPKETNTDMTKYGILLSDIEQEELQKALFKTLEPTHIQEFLKIQNEENTNLKPELTKKQAQELNQSHNSTQELFTNRKETNTEKQEIDNLKSYIDMIKSQYNYKNFDVEAIGNNLIKIRALNKDIIIVPLQNFHSYNDKYCRVCLSEIEENHEMSENHINRIMTPVADKNCFRKINNIWSHCIVCNETTENVLLHNESLKHLNLLTFTKSRMIQVVNVQNQAEEEKLDIAPQVEEFFNQIIPKKAIEIDPEISDDLQLEGLKNERNTLEKQSGNQSSTTKKETHNYIAEFQTNKSEINQSVHQNNNDRTSNALPKPSQYCYVCRIVVANFNIHKQSKSHKLKIEEDKKRAQELKNTLFSHNILQDKTKTSTKCGLCLVNLIFDKDLIESHINTDVHKNNYLKFMEVNDIIIFDEREYHCVPCNQRQLRKYVFYHCSSLHHANKLKKHLNNTAHKNPPKKNSDTETFIKTTEILTLFYHFEDNNKNLRCKTCSVSIPKIYSVIEKHLVSTEHWNTYNLIMKDNKVQINKNSFYCEICSVKILLGNEIEHVYSNSHSLLKSKIKLTESIQNNTQPIPSTSKGVIESGPQIEPKEPEPKKIKEVMIPLYIKYQFKKANETDALCRVCDISVPNSDITEHADSFKHKFNFGALMFKNGIKIKGNIYFNCLACKTTLTRYNEMDHIFGKLHLKNLEGKTMNNFKSDLENLTIDYVYSIPGGNKLVPF